MKDLIRLISIRHFFIHRLRAALTFFGIVLGVALYASVAILADSTKASFRESIESLAGTSQLTVSGTESGFSEGILQQIEEDSEIKHAIPVIENKAYFVNQKNEMVQMMVLGLDMLREGSVRSYETEDEEDILQDPLVFLNQIDSVIVTQTFAQENRLQFNDHITLMTSAGNRKFTVRGILKPKGVAKAFGGALVIMDIDGARASFGKEGKIDRIDIVPRDAQKLETLQKTLQAQLGPAYKVRPPEGQVQDLFKLVEAFNGLLKIMGLIALLTSAFLVYNTISISIKEREFEIATLRVLGMSRAKVLSFILGEGVIFGSLGALVGGVLGVLVAQLSLTELNNSLSAQMITSFRVRGIEIKWTAYVISFALGVAVTLLAIIKPAWSASRTDPIAILKRNQSVMESDRFFKYLFWVGPVFIMLLILLARALEGTQYFALVSAIAIMGSVLFSCFCVYQTIRYLRAFCFKMGWGRFVIIIDGLLRTPRSTWISVINLSVSLCMAGIFSTMNFNFTVNIRDWFDRIFQADYLLAQGSGIVGNSVQPFRDHVMSEVRKVPGVQVNVRNDVMAVRFTDLLYKGESLKLKAIDRPPSEFQKPFIDVVESDPMSTIRNMYQQRGAIISDNMVKRFDLKPGDTLQLDSPQGPVFLPVVGVARDYASPIGVIYLPREIYKDFWKDDHVTAVQVKKQDGVDMSVFEKNLAQSLGQYGLIPTSMAEIKRQGIANVNSAFAPARVIEWISVVIAFFGLLNATYLRVHQRIPEFGMLRAIGISKKYLSWMVVFETVLQAFLVSLVTLSVIGCVLYFWYVKYFSHYLGWHIDSLFSAKSYFFIFFVSLIFAAVAAFIPSYQIRNLTVRETTTYE